MNKKRRILIVDDEQPTIDSLHILLADEFELSVARSGEEAIHKIKSETVDLVFLDIGLPGIDGFETLKQIKAYDENMVVVMLTADEKAKTAMKAIEYGAFHYLTKPYDIEDIQLTLRRAFEKKKMVEEIVSLRDDVRTLETFHNIVGQDSKMLEIYSMITKVAKTDCTVLITGESGTGKELVARAIHQQSARKDKHFKAINCGAIPDQLLESELFGHERGAFTGAHERKIGKFEMAHEGTLLLDEISTMKETLQVKLLRVLQENEIERVGGSKAIPIHVRIIAATNADVRALVERRQFREDLLYRINVVHIHLPPLRERQKDIMLLAEHFLQLFNQKFNKEIEGFTSEAKEILQDYSWPGNVRELHNVIERAVVLSDANSIDRKNLPLDLFLPKIDLADIKEPFSLKKMIETYERKLLIHVLERVGWNQTKAAEMLAIHRNTLLAKLDAFGIKAKLLKQEQESGILS